MPKKCARCGATLKQSAKFCTVCGNPVTSTQTAPTPPSPTEKLKCTNCGNPLKSGAKFCTKCGAAVEAPTIPTPTTSDTNACPHCGFGNNPASSNFCINCGQALSTEAPAPVESASVESTPILKASALTCTSCGREAKPGSKFCIFCGGPLAGAPETAEPSPIEAASPRKTAVPDIEPITVPAKILASLMARGRQLALEDELVKNGVESDELLDELSQAAGDSDFELEELIDSYINERGELERLEVLHKKGEVSERVYDRLAQEYDEKLTRMDEQIKEGITQLQGYHAQLQQDHVEVKEELETLNARLLIGDDETKDTANKETLTGKAERLNYALLACDHILKKESAMRNGPITRFEVTETTVPDSKVTNSDSEDAEVIASKAKTEKPEPSSPKPSTPHTDAEAGKICPQCGRVTAADAKFCIHCAAPL
ncbi:MAG: zinc-ribbon domain-containing protein [Promethearchaeota archaeon]